MRMHVVATLPALAILLAACAGGGMYSQPYALIESDRGDALSDTRPATVMKVDGTNRTIGQIEPVPPGKHTVEVSIPGPTGMSSSSRDTLEIDAKPCTRYYLSARRSSRTADDWRSFVSSTEPIGECVKKFSDGK